MLILKTNVFYWIRSLLLLPKSDIAAAGTARGGHGELGVVVAAVVVGGGDGGSYL